MLSRCGLCGISGWLRMLSDDKQRIRSDRSWLLFPYAMNPSDLSCNKHRRCEKLYTYCKHLQYLLYKRTTIFHVIIPLFLWNYKDSAPWRWSSIIILCIISFFPATVCNMYSKGSLVVLTFLLISLRLSFTKSATLPRKTVDTRVQSDTAPWLTKGIIPSVRD